MTSIRNRPTVVPPSPSRTAAPQTAARPAQANTVAQTNAVARTQASSFQSTAAVRAAPTQPTPGAWRGGPDTEVGRAIQGMLSRMQGTNITIKGDTPVSLFSRAILDNKHVTNEQLLAMGKISLEQLATDPETRAKVLKKVPDARELPVHKFTVAMLASATGIDPQKLSEACPDLGLTGAPNTPLLFAADGEGLQRSTALHDFTDYLRGAGLKGMNKAVWGVENRVLSAIVSAVGGGRY